MSEISDLVISQDHIVVMIPLITSFGEQLFGEQCCGMSCFDNKKSAFYTQKKDYHNQTHCEAKFATSAKLIIEFAVAKKPSINKQSNKYNELKIKLFLIKLSCNLEV
ncbi:hypothetical protein BpHYR1_011944 [Brachionus plicatilis]|uniref:Uncharacterized protein n=1 Tax=Brachionus plicatilis TaxID=10195 RepID=A0A3M7T0A4_BRAPC|nr:hypothetical protein BpHYR1_011944 [Brachionus plicatilis]